MDEPLSYRAGSRRAKMVINLLINKIARFAQQSRAHALVASWAFAEAVFLPVVPDVALLLLALAAPRRGLVIFTSLVAGSLIGTSLLWLLFSADPLGAQRLILGVPWVTPEQLARTVGAFASGSPLPFAVFGPGIPLKVLSLAWLEAGGWTPALPALVILNRVTRIGTLLVLFAIVGARAPDWIRRHDRLVLGGYVALWLGVYVLGQFDLLPRE